MSQPEGRKRQLQEAASVSEGETPTLTKFLSWPETQQVIFLDVLPVEKLVQWCATSTYMHGLCEKHGMLRVKIKAAKRQDALQKVEQMLQRVEDARRNVWPSAFMRVRSRQSLLEEYTNFMKLFRYLRRLSKTAEEFPFRDFFRLLDGLADLLLRFQVRSQAHPSISAAASQHWKYMLESRPRMPDAEIQRRMKEIIEDLCSFTDDNARIAHARIRMMISGMLHVQLFRNAAREAFEEHGSNDDRYKSLYMYYIPMKTLRMLEED